MSAYDQLQKRLKANPRTWLITGVAGFIGSNLLEALLRMNQRVVGLDNFATGKKQNLKEVKALVSAAQWGRFRFREGDIADLAACQKACGGVDYVLHQAALGSVPLSMKDPLGSHRSNVTGSLNMLVATPGGNTYTEAEYRQWLETAGLGEILRLDGELLVARRPR